MPEDIAGILKNNGIGILPTDTLYGLVGSVYSQVAVERIYEIKKRDENKSPIILIFSVEELKDFGVELTETAKKFTEKYWPGKVSIIFNFHNEKLSYVDKNNSGTLAFRLPDKKDLIELLRQTGPLIAPSANVQGMTPAKNIAEAKKYFGNTIDFYSDGGELISEPSTLVKINKDSIEVLREGAVKIL
jgi:L-threonylcarbamoyladenylate synthase